MLHGPLTFLNFPCKKDITLSNPETNMGTAIKDFFSLSCFIIHFITAKCTFPIIKTFPSGILILRIDDKPFEVFAPFPFVYKQSTKQQRGNDAMECINVR